MQLTHYNSKFQKQKFPVTIICDNVNNAPNIGSLFRIADAFGIEELIFCGYDIPLGKRMKRTSRSTEKYVSYRISENCIEAIDEYKAKNYQILALEITEQSTPIHQLKIETSTPIALIIGNESLGVSEAILNKADKTIHIDMFGENSSMNVVQATVITLYELTKQLKS